MKNRIISYFPKVGEQTSSVYDLELQIRNASDQIDDLKEECDELRGFIVRQARRYYSAKAQSSKLVAPMAGVILALALAIVALLAR